MGSKAHIQGIYGAKLAYSLLSIPLWRILVTKSPSPCQPFYEHRDIMLPKFKKNVLDGLTFGDIYLCLFFPFLIFALLSAVYQKNRRTESSQLTKTAWGNGECVGLKTGDL